VSISAAALTEAFYGSLEGGSGCGSGEAQVVSDFRFEKACPCQFV